MKTWAAFGTGLLVGLVVLLLVLLRGHLQRFDSLQKERNRLAADLQQLEHHLSNAAGELKVAQQAAAEALVGTTNAFRAQLEEDRAAFIKTNLALTARVPTNIVLPRPSRVRTFLGEQFVGLSWVVPSNPRRDPDTGALWYDQTVLLPENLRETLTTFVTNVIERAAYQSPQYVEHTTYVDDRPYYWWPTVPGPKPPPSPGPSPSPPPVVRPDPLPPIFPPGRPTPPPRKAPGIFVPPGIR